MIFVITTLQFSSDHTVKFLLRVFAFTFTVYMYTYTAHKRFLKACQDNFYSASKNLEENPPQKHRVLKYPKSHEGSLLNAF